MWASMANFPLIVFTNSFMVLVNAFSETNGADAVAKNVCRFVKPFRVFEGIKTLDRAPFTKYIPHVGCVVFVRDQLEYLGDGRLCFAMG